MAQLANVSEIYPSSEATKPSSNTIQKDPVVSPSIPLAKRKESFNNIDEESCIKSPKNNDSSSIADTCNESKDPKEKEDLNQEEEEQEDEDEEEEDDCDDEDGDDDFEFDDAFDDETMDFGNFGMEDPGNSPVHLKEGAEENKTNDSPSQSCSSSVNKEQQKMELFWKLCDMGFSRERTVEAVHEKGFTDAGAAAEYLLTTGNLEGYSVENMAPKEHKYEKHPFHPNNQSQFLKAVSREGNLLKSSLPDGIYVRTFEDRMDLFSVMIHGPEKTPYEDGLFFFDVQLSPSYPKQPPKFHFHSYSKRLNPNLYVEGKVCVSLLGTWSGQGSENWDSSNSNLLQVLISIQGLILVNEPYFNEPGYAGQKGTKAGRKSSRRYNEMVLIENLASLTRLAENPPPLFHNEVREHLNERWYILAKRLENWAEECKTEKDTMVESDNSISLPDFPLAPVSSEFSSVLKRSLESFERAVEKLVNKDLLSKKDNKS